MVKEERVNKICISRGMKRNSVSTVPTWIDDMFREGIELQAGKLIPFWVINGVRNYTEPTGEKIKKTISIIMEIDNISESEPVKEIIKTEHIDGILPEFLTSALLSKWSQMTTTDRILLFQKTPADKIKSVCIGKENGKELYASYVEGNYMFREANAAFLFDWYIDIKEVTVATTGVSVRGTLYGWFNEYQKYLSRPATGYQELNKKVDSELAKKGATTDAIKKGLSLFGFNSDVYSGEV